MNFPFPRTQAFIEEIIASKQGSGLAIFVEAQQQQHHAYFGNHGHSDLIANPQAVSSDSIFDLASLTKIFCSLPLIFNALEVFILQGCEN